MYGHHLHLTPVSRNVLGTKQQMVLYIHRPQKAYNSVSKEALWMILQKLSVPEKSINLLCTFHQTMSAKIG